MRLSAALAAALVAGHVLGTPLVGGSARLAPRASPSPSPPAFQRKGHLRPGAIVGIVVGSVVFLFLVIFGWLWFKRRGSRAFVQDQDRPPNAIGQVVGAGVVAASAGTTSPAHLVEQGGPCGGEVELVPKHMRRHSKRTSAGSSVSGVTGSGVSGSVYSDALGNATTHASPTTPPAARGPPLPPASPTPETPETHYNDPPSAFRAPETPETHYNDATTPGPADDDAVALALASTYARLNAGSPTAAGSPVRSPSRVGSPASAGSRGASPANDPESGRASPKKRAVLKASLSSLRAQARGLAQSPPKAPVKDDTAAPAYMTTQERLRLRPVTMSDDGQSTAGHGRWSSRSSDGLLPEVPLVPNLMGGGVGGLTGSDGGSADGSWGRVGGLRAEDKVNAKEAKKTEARARKDSKEEARYLKSRQTPVKG